MLNKNIECEVTGIRDYGIFCSCGEYNGLIHISEISEQYINNVEGIFNVGNKLLLNVLEIDEKHKKLRLSYKKAHPIHDRIRRHVIVINGFNSLKEKMPEWIESKLSEIGNNENENN